MRSLESVAGSTLAPAGSRRRLPLRPRFLQELAVIPADDGIVIDGGKQPRILEGAAARLLLPKLLPLMDGTRSIAQIQEQLPDVRAANLHEAISLLSNWALIEDAETDGAADEVFNPETLAFFRRHAANSGRRTSAREACRDLKRSEIILIDSGRSSAASEILQCLLLRVGVSQVKTFAPHSLFQAAQSFSPAPLLVSLSLGEENYDWHAQLDDYCYAHNRQWLRAGFHAGQRSADLGPLFNPVNACYRCFHALHVASQHSAVVISGRADDVAETQIFLSLLATEIINLLTHLGPPLTERGFARYELAEWNAKNLRCARIPGCSRCRPLRSDPDAQLSAVIDTAVVFEDYIGLPSRPHSLPGGEQESSEISELTGQTTRLINCSKILLSRLEPNLPAGVLNALAKTTEIQSTPLIVDHLAAILRLSAGLRDLDANSRTMRRWAATAGNLGSVELFVIALNVLGLAPGIYFYQAGDHSLARLERRNVAPALVDLLRRIAPPEASASPDALVIFTGAFHRVSRKYSQFGYRLLHFDAGVALSHLHLVAHALNIPSQTVTRWPDDLLEQQLNLTPVQQQITAVAALRGCSNGQTKVASGSQQVTMAGMPVSAKPVREFSEVSGEQLFGMLMEESRLREHSVHSSIFAVPAELQSAIVENPAAIPFPAFARTMGSTGDVLAARASVRHFSAEAISASQIGSMLDHAHQGDCRDWPMEHAQSRTLTFLVLASRVQGLNRGTYAYSHDDHTLVPLRPALAEEEMAELFVQSEFASAPVVVWIAGNLAAACARYGAFGHRQLLVRAGEAVNRLWMAALAVGLKGCIVAGVVPGAARQRLHLDGYRRASLIALAVGHETS